MNHQLFLQPSTSSQPLRRGFLVVGLMILLIALLFSLFKTTSLPAPAPLPNPNGYDDFVKAIAERRGGLPDTQAATTEELRQLVEQNQKTLELVRLGLSRECKVPIEYSQGYESRLLGELAGLKGLAILLKAEGQLAEKENRNSDAVRSYLDGIRFGQEIARGGLLINSLVGLACEAIGTQPLQRLRAGLSAQECRQAIKTLEEMDHKQEDAKTIFAHEKLRGRQIGGWTYPMRYLLEYRLVRPAHEKFEQKWKDRATRRKLLTIELALRSFQLENGTFPARLSELAPRYLATLPLDPYSGTNFFFVSQSNHFQVYSVGPDGKNDGGVPMARLPGADIPRGDLFLDSRY